MLGRRRCRHRRLATPHQGKRGKVRRKNRIIIFVVKQNFASAASYLLGVRCTKIQILSRTMIKIKNTRQHQGEVLLLSISVILLHLIGVTSHREHKVHNIVLYPDKHSWCKTLPIKQVISYPNCKSEEIDNNVCVGACFSYSIPHTEPSDPGEVIVPYCDSCQPSDTTWHHVTLECTKNNPENTPPQLLKRVQIINNCSCTSCEKNHFNPTNEFDDDFDNLMNQNNDVPDLLNFLNSRNETNSIVDSEHTKKMRTFMNHKIVTLLKNIQQHNSQADKEQLMDLLRVVQGPNQKANDKAISDFVESLNTENIELDISRLKEILNKFEHSKYYEKHKKQHSDEILDSIEGSNIGMGHLKGVHIGLGLRPATLEEEKPKSDFNEELPEDDETQKTAHQTPEEHQSSETGSSSSSSINHHNPSKYHHHHHLGDKILGHGHLARGPHGALVIEPDRIHEKLDVNPHELKPNHAGTLLSYSSHSTDKSKILD